MDSTTLLSLVGGFLLLSIIFASSLCTYCWGYKHPTSISQRSSDSSPEYNSTFGVSHLQSTYAHHPDHHRIPGTSFSIHNLLASPSITITKVSSCAPSETESQASYENQTCNEDVPLASEYITVLAETGSRGSQEHSQVSSQSSGGDSYINVGHTSVSGPVVDSDIEFESHNYENVQSSSNLTEQTVGLSCGSLSSEDSYYVNTNTDSQ